MSLEFKNQLIQELEEHRLTKRRGIRASNKSVAQDASATVKRIHREVQVSLPIIQSSRLILPKMEHLFERCGVSGVAIFSKGHVQDKSIPWIVESALGGGLLERKSVV